MHIFNFVSHFIVFSIFVFFLGFVSRLIFYFYFGKWDASSSLCIRINESKKKCKMSAWLRFSFNSTKKNIISKWILLLFLVDVTQTKLGYCIRKLCIVHWILICIKPQTLFNLIMDLFLALANKVICRCTQKTILCNPCFVVFNFHSNLLQCIVGVDVLASLKNKIHGKIVLFLHFIFWSENNCKFRIQLVLIIPPHMQFFSQFTDILFLTRNSIYFRFNVYFCGCCCCCVSVWMEDTGRR